MGLAGEEVMSALQRKTRAVVPRSSRWGRRAFTEAAERQASAGARDGVKGKRSDLAARAPLHALVRRAYASIGSVATSSFANEQTARRNL